MGHRKHIHSFISHCLNEENKQVEYNKFPLNSLVKFAKKFNDFKEFSHWFSIGLNHGYYWHLTENKDFQISDKISPRDMSSFSSGKDRGDYGALMITGHLDYWDEYYNTNPRTGVKNVTRNYVALFDASDLDPKSLTQVSRGFGNEIYLHKNEANKLKLIGVYNREYAKRLDRKFHKMIPGSENELFHLWQYANDNKTSYIHPLSESYKTPGNSDYNSFKEWAYGEAGNGAPGFNNMEDAIEYLDWFFGQYENIPKVLTLYRILQLEEPSELNKDHIGLYFTDDKDNFTTNFLQSLGFTRSDINKGNFHIVTIEVDRNEINWENTITTRLRHPYEDEYTLKKDAKYSIVSIDKWDNNEK